jgi:hypothetical protein
MKGLYRLWRTAVCGAARDTFLRSSMLPAMYSQAQLQEHQKPNVFCWPLQVNHQTFYTLIILSLQRLRLSTIKDAVRTAE